jgi:GDP-L-fucose synthase
MKIWVTGAGGSLGKALISNLSLISDQVILAPSRAELDLEDTKAVTRFVEINKPSHVFHLAAKVFGISGHLEDPQASLLVNTRIDNAVFSALSLHPPKWIYYSSTVAAYGFPYTTLPLQEIHFLKGQPHISELGYSISKRFSLNYLEMLKQLHGTQFAYGLTTNLFGSGDRFNQGRGHVVVSLLEKAKIARLKRTPLEVWGHGAASRDFLSTNDAAKILVSLMDLDVGVINIASGEEILISEIAEFIVRAFDIDMGYKFVGVNEGILNRVCSTQKLAKVSRHLDNVNSRVSLKHEIIEFEKRSN